MNAYGLKIKYKNSFDLVSAYINMFSSVSGHVNKDAAIRPKLIRIITYYVLRGYNDDTKEFILKAENMNITNLNQCNSELQNKGYLVKDRWLDNVRHLNPSLSRLSEYIKQSEEGKNKFLLVAFEKEQ